MKVIDFFCGMGGASLGYKLSGHEVILAIDKWEDALKTHKYNLPEVPILYYDLASYQSLALPNAELFHFSPPCQSFSTAGKQQGFNSENGNLFIVSLKIILSTQFQPLVFVVENVKGLLSYLKSNKIDEFEKLKENYNITSVLIDAKDCGVCQRRERVFIIGIKKGVGKFVLPKPIENTQTFRSVIDAVKDYNYGYPNHSKSLVDKIKFIPQGGNVMNIPEEVRPKAFKNSYSRLRVDKIPPTITRNYNCPSSANCIHPFENRGLTEAEALFIQGFPKSWKVIGKQKNLQIGNSVPPQMIEWIINGVKLEGGNI